MHNIQITGHQTLPCITQDENGILLRSQFKIVSHQQPDEVSWDSGLLHADPNYILR